MPSLTWSAFSGEVSQPDRTTPAAIATTAAAIAPSRVVELRARFMAAEV